MKAYYPNNFIKLYLFGFVICLLGFILAYQKNRLLSTHAICRNCNVVMLSLDLLRASSLPCYGYVHNTMPKLCEFADKEIRFTNAHTQSTRTLPNETSIFTSLYESNHGVNNVALDTLHPSIKTLGEHYKNAGYQTIFIGTEVEGNIPLFGAIKKSFDVVKILHPKSSEEELQEWIGMIKRIEDRKNSDPPIFLYIYSGYMQQYHQEDLFTIKKFLFDPTFQAPHIPDLFTFHAQTVTNAKETLRYNIYNSIGKLSKDTYTNILEKLESSHTLTEAKQAFEMLPQLEQRGIYYHEVNDILDAKNPSHRRYMQNLYDNRLASFDELLSIFLDQLQHPTIMDNTIVTIFSDHGESLGDNGLFGHSKTPHDATTHVPLIMHVPNIPKKVYTPIVQLVDLMPTLLRLTAIPIPQHLVGSDISGIFWDQPLIPPAGTFAITEKPGTGVVSIKTDTWRLIVYQEPSGPMQRVLYNVITDPAENINVASLHTDVVTKLTTQLNDMIQIAPRYPHNGRPAYITPILP